MATHRFFFFFKDVLFYCISFMMLNLCSIIKMRSYMKEGKVNYYAFITCESFYKVWNGFETQLYGVALRYVLLFPLCFVPHLWLYNWVTEVSQVSVKLLSVFCSISLSTNIWVPERAVIALFLFQWNSGL